MKILALITARKGSKRIPGKNVKDFGGKPLINWTIDAAREVEELTDILISTDDPAVAKIGKEKGVLIPWFRPAELSTDKASSIDVCLHALNWYEDEKGPVDGLLLLQPTSPFRTVETINRGIELFMENPEIPVIGFSESAVHPYWCFEKKGEFLTPIFGLEKFTKRTQDLPPTYTLNGGFYLIAPSKLRQNKSFYSESVIPLFMNRKESIDIDDPSDWKNAESQI